MSRIRVVQEEIKVSIAEQLQKQRKLHNLSQDELADKLGISRQAISRWENGATLPSFYNVLAISDLFHISLDELIRGDELFMEKLENSNKTKKTLFNNFPGLFTVSTLIALVIWGLAKLSNFYGSLNFIFYYWIVTIVAIVGLLMNLEWKGIGRECRRNINSKTAVWIIVLLVLYIIPRFNLIFTGKF